MRTTVTLDEDVAAGLQELARERGLTFKQALNSAVRSGLTGRHEGAGPYRLTTRALGLRPGVDLDKALALDGALEDEETVRSLELRK